MVASLFVGCSKSIEQQIAEQLELGQKYLADANYEEAVVIFEKVIDLDSKRFEAYSGIIEAYIKDGNDDKAYQWIANGLQQAENKEESQDYVNAWIDMLCDDMEDEKNFDMISRLYGSLSEERQELVLTKIQDYTGFEIINNQSDLIGELVDLYQMEDYDGIISCINENINDLTINNKSDDIVFYSKEDSIIPNGFGVGVYFGNKGMSLLYIGDWKDGKRHGTGTDYFIGSSGQNGYIIGEWENDIPNGKAKKHILYSDGRITEYVGQAVNGYAEGTFQMLNANTEGNISGYEFQCKEGIPQSQGHGFVEPGDKVSEDIMCLRIDTDGSKEPVWHTWSGLRCAECNETGMDPLDFMNACDHSWAGWGEEKTVFSFMVD